MTVIALAGCSGSPGVSTTGLALLLSWPLEPGRRVVLAECDPDGGSVLFGLLQGSLSDRYGLRNLSVAHRKGELREAFWRQLVDMSDDSAAADVPRRRLVLPGLTDPAQAAALGPAWEPQAEMFAGISAHPQYPHDVVVDLGRRGAFGPSGVLARRADTVVLVTRSTMRSVQSAQSRVEVLRQHVGEVGLLVIEEGPYSVREVERTLQAPVIASLPHRAESAKVLSDGAAQPRRFADSELMRSAQRAASALRQRALLRQSRLAPRDASASGAAAASPSLAGGEVGHAR
ncbi:hypothetical protein LKL35_36590 [Streptomyces sp. ET3-23]|uniref:hypothetical protein n=1 Tax=Streptomyces sp. ET3-23 TaxID=2885643 RepID=UPI001D12D6BE|nr:hypothetical protein [Streptomyces sp. ET3-23]MCC2280848.1 hypothetical protein [Streptomyces sp. ET3-23]